MSFDEWAPHWEVGIRHGLPLKLPCKKAESGGTMLPRELISPRGWGLPLKRNSITKPTDFLCHLGEWEGKKTQSDHYLQMIVYLESLWESTKKNYLN